MILAMVLDSGVSFLICFSDDTQILPTFLEQVYIGSYLKGSSLTILNFLFTAKMNFV